MLKTNNILILEDSEHSFLVLGKDIMESVRGSSPDEGVSECDYNGEQSVFSSVSHHCHSDTIDNNLHKMLIIEQKMKAFKEKFTSASQEISEHRGLLRSVGGSIDEIDRTLDHVLQSFYENDFCKSPSTKSRDCSVDSIDTDAASVESFAEQAQGTSDNADEFSMEMLTNNTMIEQIDRTKDELVKNIFQMNQSLETFLSTATENLSSIKEALASRELNCTSSHSSEIMSQVATLELDDMMHEAKYIFKKDSSSITDKFAKCKKPLMKDNQKISDAEEQIVQIAAKCIFKKDSSSITDDLAKCKKPLMKDNQKISDAEEQIGKILTDHSLMVSELASVAQENKKLKAHITLLEEEKRQNFENKDDLMETKLAELKIGIQALEEKRDAYTCEKKYLRDKIKALNKLIVRQESSLIDNAMIWETKVLLLKEINSELENKFADVKGKSDALHYAEKINWVQERKNLIESNELLKDALKSRVESYEILRNEYILLQTRSDMMQVDFVNLGTELARAHTRISELQKQNADLQEIENAVDVYKNRNQQQEKDILRLRATEKHHLHKIELLTGENSVLRDYMKYKLLKE